MAARKRKTTRRRKRSSGPYCVIAKGRRGSLTFECGIRTKKSAEAKARSARRSGKTAKITTDRARPR